jgi:hypothetical protein
MRQDQPMAYPQLRFDPESHSSIKYRLLWRRLDKLLFSLDGK